MLYSDESANSAGLTLNGTQDTMAKIIEEKVLTGQASHVCRRASRDGLSVTGHRPGVGGFARVPAALAPNRPQGFC